MARTRADPARKGRQSSAPKEQGKRPQVIHKNPSRRSHRLQERATPEQSQHLQIPTAPDKRVTKRLADSYERDLGLPPKRRRRSRKRLVENTCGASALSKSNSRADDLTDPIAVWAKEGRWPRAYFELDMEHLLARNRSFTSLSRKRSNSATSMTPSDQRPREEKSTPYRDPRYKTLLETKGSFMDEADVGIAEESKYAFYALLSSKQTVPRDSLLRDDLFKQTVRRVEDRNEARVLRDITPLIAPSAEIVGTYGAKHLSILIESVNEGWNNSIPLAGKRPQPDYSVGFRRDAFTDDQLAKLSPFIGDFIAGDQSLFMATYYMYFPFLTCEVKCGAAALDVADRQNAHSMTLAVRAIAELFRAVKRECEVHWQILAFSISHDHRSVRIYGHYPVIDGKDTKYYRHPIRTFDFTELDGKEKWTAYRFTKNIYDTWMPAHFEKIRSAIDQLPSDLEFGVPSLPETGLSQGLGSLMPSEPDSASSPVNQDSQSSNAEHQGATPGTSFTEPEVVKRRKGIKK